MTYYRRSAEFFKGLLDGRGDWLVVLFTCITRRPVDSRLRGNDGEGLQDLVVCWIKSAMTCVAQPADIRCMEELCLSVLYWRRGSGVSGYCWQV